MSKGNISANNGRSLFVFTWKIKNYSFCYKKKGEHIASPLFYIENLCCGQWYLMLYPKGIKKLKDDENFVSCSLGWKPQDGVSETPAVKYSLEIANEAGDVLTRRSSQTRVFTKKERVWGMQRLIKMDELAAVMGKWPEDVLVLRCRMKCCRLRKQTIFETEACTIIDVDRRFFEWDVKIPISLQYSESIVFPFSDSCSFNIVLFENMSVYIQLISKQYSLLTRPVKFKIVICDEKDKEITSKCVVHLFSAGEIWQFPDILTNTVLEACKVDSCICNFMLKAEICISQGTTSISSIEKLSYVTSACANFVPKDTSMSAMQTDFRNLYNNKKYCDMTIKAGDCEFLAHKLVLRMRSPVFMAMFDQDMLEKSTGIVNVDDVDQETMKSFLEFLYTGNLDTLDYERAKNLILAADKYQVPSLVDMCVSFLKCDVSVKNLLDIITLSDSLSNCKSLKTFALYFVKIHVVKILKSSYWRDWMKDNIITASDILSKLYANLDSKCK